MRAYEINRGSFDRTSSPFLATHTRIADSLSVGLLNRLTRPEPDPCLARNTQAPRVPRQQTAELLENLDGLPKLVSRLVQDVLAELPTDLFSQDSDIRSILPSTLERIADRMRGSPLRHKAESERHLEEVKVPSSEGPLSNAETTLRVGTLELDLIDRTAKRGERRIDLRPREFLLLKYMMQRSDKVMTRATLLKEVWQYKFVPETNLVDVHLGRLRRKVDAANEAPMIRNIRGVGFVLSANPLVQAAPARRHQSSYSRRQATVGRLMEFATPANDIGSIVVTS